VVHLESVFSRTPRSWQGSHSSGGAARAVAVLHRTAGRFCVSSGSPNCKPLLRSAGGTWNW